MYESFGKLYFTEETRHCPICGELFLGQGAIKDIMVDDLLAERLYDYLTEAEFHECLEKCDTTKNLVDLMREKLKGKIELISNLS